ncbi:putative 16S rRNA-processing protein RimM [Halomicronema hongdechloris C2206]|uniref:Ribosome maturation factor RimM n=1 Tax=Halomicronema hongdechloris C2206 TaxID=1641165 RepID=A0A1Z3HFQ5_9CYAN|nr:ribosome maturation factor RimM [Halomicronema hongdechloris]ASC69111.1 putative 16S rRNA-processing protein RimM [Halomicronema hongdechloris C2206]
MWLEVGKIVAPHGLQGEVRVYPNSDFPERFTQPGRRWVRHAGQDPPQPVDLRQGRFLNSKGLYVVRLAQVTTRQQAEALRHCQLLVPETERLPLEPGEFHVADLIGLEVRLLPAKTPIGRVVDVFSAGNDLLAVTLDQSSQPSAAEKPPSPVLIPFVEAIVPMVNLEQGWVEIDPPAGLLGS